MAIASDSSGSGKESGTGAEIGAAPRAATADATKEKSAHAADPGVRLESLGKGVSSADVDEKTNQVIIRRSARVIERFADDNAIAEFANKKKLSNIDRETLTKLSEIRNAEPAIRAEAKLKLGPDVQAREADLVNSIAQDTEKGHIRTSIERNNAETYVWVEEQKKLRQQRAQPVETAPIAAASPTKQEAKGDDTIEKKSTFSSPNAQRMVPPEIGSQYLLVGERYYHPNNTKSVAFVDRGDKLETPSSAPKTAEALVKIAESRGWEDLRVKGTEGFRREVWLEASVRGIHVDGYKPSELDMVELERRDTFMRDQNSVEVRSEAFQKLPAAEGVRKDPSLASAYATEAAAKRFAEEKVQPENRAAFVQSVRETLTRRLEQGETAPIKINVPEGKLVEHGAAPYNFDKDEKLNYYVKLAEANGRERIYWGVGLEKALATSGAQPGDSLQLRVTGSKEVIVEDNMRDAQGKVVGQQAVDSHRNEWQAEITARARARQRQVPSAQER